MASQDPKTNPNNSVVEEITGWLKVYNDGTVERAGPQEAGPLITPVTPYDTPQNGVTVHDLQTDPPLRLYLRDPSICLGHRALILVHLHGGGFCVSHPSWRLYHDFYARLLISLEVSAIVAPILPLAPEHRLPASIDTAFSTLLWLRSIAIAKNISQTEETSQVIERIRETTDFSRVYLIGDSSGGNLVHEVSSRAGVVGPGLLYPVRVAGSILLHPGFAYSKRSRSEMENPPSPFLNLEMIDKMLPLAVPIGESKDHPYVCPMGKAAPPMEGLQMPPVLLAVAEMDLLIDPQLEYLDAMKKSGKEIELVTSHGMSHVFYLNKFAVEGDPVTGEMTKELIEAIKKFVDSH